MSDYDVVIAGGGHNALACGAYLAKHGLSVCVVERNPWYGVTYGPVWKTTRSD